MRLVFAGILCMALSYFFAFRAHLAPSFSILEIWFLLCTLVTGVFGVGLIATGAIDGLDK